MLITPPLRKALAAQGVTALYPGQFALPDNTELEAPCALKRVQAHYALRMGAFSSVRSGFFLNVRIGRYVTIEDGAQIGRGSHPVTWGSTSPLLYLHHKHVFDLELPEAEGFALNTPHFAPSKPVIIGNDVHIGRRAYISPGVTIGDGAVIEPHAVVTKDVAPYAIVSGNPGIVVGARVPVRVAARMIAVAWWRFAFWDLQGAPVDKPSAFLDHVQKLINGGLQPWAPAPINLPAFAAAHKETV
jgi:acetyltransferase-like isoleucine patch superfamily enzyme